jgi:cytochrome P450
MPREHLPYYPERRTDPFQPAPNLAALRQRGPVVKARIWSGQEVWLATRYKEAREVLTNYEHFTQVPGPGYPTTCAGRESTVKLEVPNFVRMDPPDHSRQRSMVARPFIRTAVVELRPSVETFVDELLDNMERRGAPADLVTEFTLPLPTTVITKYLGLPLEDHDFITNRSGMKLNLEVSGETARQAQIELLDYLEMHLMKKAETPEAGDIMSNLMRDYVTPGKLDLPEAVSVIELLVTAGHETTANMLALGTLCLLQHPDQLAKLRAEPGLMGSAVNELMRYLTINENVCGRLCVKDTELGGQQIKAGEGVFALIQSANRDESVYPDSDRLDITRNPVNHMGFGYGVHLCLGNLLAKLEMEVAFSKLLERLPNLHLAVPFEELEFKNEAVVFGVRSLPVAW